MPPGFQVAERHADAWLPLGLDASVRTTRKSHVLNVFARLKPDATPERAQAETRAMMEQIARDFPEQDPRVGAAVVPLREQVTGDTRKPLAVLMVAVALVLLIACINVGNLMLSRAAARGREIAVRSALGAGRWRITRLVLSENVPLVVLGTALGLTFAFWSLAFLRQLVPPALAQSAELGLDMRVLAFTLGIAVVSSVLFGLAPALRAPKVDLNDVLRQNTGRSGFSAGGRLQSALVVGEVGLAIVLLVAASLLIQTFFLLRGQYSDLGTARVLTMKTVLSRAAYDTHAKREAFVDRVLERVRALPGVEAAGYTNALPLDYKGDSTAFAVEGRAPDPQVGNNADVRLVTPEYLEALGVRVVAGRHLAETDAATGQPVAVVNEAMARQCWPGEEAVGKRIKVGDPEDDSPWATVVGVVADVRQNGVDAPVYAEMYFPYRQCDYVEWAAPRTLAIRTSGDQAALAAAVRREVAAIDPNQPVSDVKTMTEILGKELAARRLAVQMLGAFAAVALLLASIGIYGLLAQRVAQMTQEIGVRLALGATPRAVLSLVVGRGMRLVLIGTGVGLALSLVLTRLMSSLLFGVDASDPLTLVGVPVLLAAVALVACYGPARRAARIHPNVALRYE
jgi:putative ABC transport system permease protein